MPMKANHGRFASKIDLILANSGEEDGVWDKRNSGARKRLVAANLKIQHRMFNNDTDIGHNKFVVQVVGNKPKAVLTGSTNWNLDRDCRADQQRPPDRE